jgi:glycosyltransferase involved in cell wall biosynthesis
MGSGPLPRVSVLMVTYNHADYLTEAIESVLSQEGDIPFEIVLADDSSTDGTHEIVATYNRKYPLIVQSIVRERNIGFQRNFIDALKHCRGEYVATLDGDDYWLCVNKMKDQAAMLDRNPNHTICFGKSLEVYEGNDPPPRVSPILVGTEFTLEDLLRWDFIPTCTAMFRFVPRFDVPIWATDLPMTDWVLWVLLAQRGNILHIPTVLGAYRKHAKGVWTSKSVNKQIEADETFYRAMRSYLPRNYAEVIDQGLDRLQQKRMQLIGLGL